ncbi:unknown [Clostridium sp. CAG:58]|nr:unknown [Clostridium sp. CAG:58]
MVMVGVIMAIVAMSGLVLMVVIMTIVAVGMAVKPVSGNEFAGFMGMGVGVSMIMNVLALLFLPENSHIHMCSRDPAFYGRFRFHLHARQTQSIHFSKKFFLLFRTQL